jgi:gamma-glutamylputrescine oxidase
MSHLPSFWEQDTLLKSDFIIIGAGLTGLYTALELHARHPGKRIVVLERGSFSSGASTRNAGFACFGNVSEILDDLKHDDEETVYRLMDARYRGLQRTARLLGENRIGLEFKGSHEVFTSQNQQDWEQAFEYIPRANAMFKEICGLREVFQVVSTTETLPFHRCTGAISNAREGQLHTGKLYQALWQRVIYSGIVIHGGSEVASVEEHSAGVKLTLSNGMQWHSDQLLVCNNAFAATLMPELEVVPARGQILVTEPFEHRLSGIYHYDHGYYYWRDLGDRILLGGARNADFEGEHSYESQLNPRVQSTLENFLYEQILGGTDQKPAVAMRWSGIMGFGPSKQPIIRSLSERIHAAVRLGGMGVALSSVMAEELAKKV